MIQLLTEVSPVFLAKDNIFAEVFKSLISKFVFFQITSSSILMSIAEIIQPKSIYICSRISSLFCFVALSDSFSMCFFLITIYI